MSLECAGTIWSLKERVPDVSPRSGFYHTIAVKTRWSAKSGPKTIVAAFSAEEMVDVNGSAKINVYN